MSSAEELFAMRICGSSRASAAIAGSSEGKTLSVTAMTGRATGMLLNLAEPAHDTGDAVDRDLRPVRYPPRRVEHAEHHRDAALARKRSKVRGRAAELGHHAGDARQDMGERRAGHFCHQNIAGADAGELAFAAHHHRTARAPADPGRVPAQTRMPQPDLL